MVLHTFQNRSLRVPFQRPVLVKVVGDGSRTLGATALNLSSQGMFLSTPEAIAPGTQLHLALLAGGRLLPFAHAVVVRESMAPAQHLVGVGVQFTTFLHPRAAEMIGHVVSLIDTADAAPVQRLPRRKTTHRVWAVAATLLFVAGASFAAVRLQAPAVNAQPTLTGPAALPNDSSVEKPDAPGTIIEESPAAQEPTATHSRTFHLSTGTIKTLTLTENEGALSVDVDTTRRTNIRAVLLEKPRRLKLDIDTRGPKAPKTIATGLASATAVHVSRLKNKTQLIVSLSEQVTLVNADGGRFELSLRAEPENPLRLGRAGIAAR
jgi:PilZ domain